MNIVNMHMQTINQSLFARMCSTVGPTLDKKENLIEG